MNYLLSTGVLTTDKLQYIRDILFLNLGISSNEIPYFEELGYDKLVLEENEDDFLDIAKTRITELLRNISSRNETSLTLSDLYISNNTLIANINLEDEIITYEFS